MTHGKTKIGIAPLVRYVSCTDTHPPFALHADRWKCVKCFEENAPHISTCQCGEQREVMSLTVRFKRADVDSIAAGEHGETIAKAVAAFAMMHKENWEDGL